MRFEALHREGDVMPTHKHPNKKRTRQWVRNVKTTAIAVPEQTMTKSAEEVADILLHYHTKSEPGSINRYIQFYINRAGRGLSGERRKTLRKAMEIIRTQHA